MDHNSRLHSVDVLRGFALMGLFAVHMVSFYGLHWINPSPSATFDIVSWLFGGKSYALFALLFGFSFFIIFERQAKKGVDFRLRFCWRMVLLAIIGYLHSLFYTGDILQVLALIGLLLVAINNIGNKGLLAIALFFLLHIPTYLFLIYLNFDPELANANPEFWGLTAVSNNVAANESFFRMLLTNLFDSQIGKWWFYVESGRLWNIIGFSILGLWLGKVGFFTHFIRFKTAIVVGVITSLLCYMLVLHASSINIEGALAGWSLGTAIYSYLNAALMLTTSLVFLCFFQMHWGVKVLRHLAACGRMTLTLYVAQSVIFTPLFFGYGLGLYDTMTHVQAVLLAVIFWLAQVLFANTWFKHFQYGPLEWCWRAATFMKTDIPFTVKTSA